MNTSKTIKTGILVSYIRLSGNKPLRPKNTCVSHRLTDRTFFSQKRLPNVFSLSYRQKLKNAKLQHVGRMKIDCDVSNQMYYCLTVV